MADDVVTLPPRLVETAVDACGNCVFSYRALGSDGQGSILCRRNPPMTFITGFHTDGAQQHAITRGFFPPVDAVGCWCGEHKRRSTE